MCFGPMRQPDRPKVINDMTPDVFEKVLGFAHGTDGELQLDPVTPGLNNVFP